MIKQGIKFDREIWTPGFASEILPLAIQHHHEINPFPDLKLGINLDHYSAVQENGNLRLYTARNGELIGYAAYILFAHPHYDSSVHATQDCVFLVPNHRRGLLGGLFLRWCDEKLREQDVHVVYQSSSVEKNIGPILEWIGYKKIEDNYARRLN